jgi:tRNA-modifying protein YgfZ
MNDPTTPETPAALPFLGVLCIAGPDAVGFLQGQVTSDVRLLADGRTQLAALNTPQGRVVALPRLRQVGETIYALLPAELLEPVCGLLRRFVLRSRVQLQIAADLSVRWVDAEAATPRQVAFDYAAGRRLVVAPADSWAATGGTMEPPRPGIENEWRAMDIADGLPQVFVATSGAFVAQMLNLDLLDAVSFTKGCYTGQEIVARTQHLGRIKRRLLRYRLPSGPPPAALKGLYRDGMKVAEVLLSAECDEGVQLLAVANLDARGLPLRTEDGRPAEPMELRYAIPAAD